MAETRSYFRKLRFISIAMIICLVITTVIVVLLYPENTSQNGILSWIITIILLLFYLFFCYYLPLFGSKEPFGTSLRYGTRFGLLAGTIWIIHMAIIHLIHLQGNLGTLLTWGFMLLELTVFGYAGYLIMVRTGSVMASLLASVWSAMLSILILFIGSWILTFSFMPWIEKILIGDPDYLISGMIKISDYTIHHNIESAGIHLLEAPVLALIVGFTGTLFSRLKKRVVGH
jgi:hypothetical protein